jgi:hypothetical protein
VPNTAGYGPMGGLIAEFPRRVNATANSLNRSTVIMDVLIRQAAFARQTGNYLAVFQTTPTTDAELFIDVRDQASLPGAARPLGIGGVYGGDVMADQWHRIAWVANLAAPTNQPRFQAYVNGQLATSLVWDELLAEGLATNDSVKLDLTDSTMPAGALQADGRFSILNLAQLSQGTVSEPQTSAFFLFNDNSDELGEVFVAHLQVRDEPLSSEDQGRRPRRPGERGDQQVDHAIDRTDPADTHKIGRAPMKPAVGRERDLVHLVVGLHHRDRRRAVEVPQEPDRAVGGQGDRIQVSRRAGRRRRAWPVSSR